MATFERLLNVLTLLGPPAVDVKPTSALKGHLRRLSFGKGSFIVKTFKVTGIVYTQASGENDFLSCSKSERHRKRKNYCPRTQV